MTGCLAAAPLYLSPYQLTVGSQVENYHLKVVLSQLG